jgi:hypothetical protein
MSSPKFAAMTATLLVRKGEAAPSPLAAPPLRALPFWAQEKPQARPVPDGAPAPDGAPMPEMFTAPAIESAFRAPPLADPLRPRKIIVALSPVQHDVLAIAAAKTGKTRPQMMRDALSAYLTGLARDYGADCACVAQGVQRANAGIPADAP